MKSSLIDILESLAAASLAVLLVGPALADPPRFSIKDITPGLPEPGAGGTVINDVGQVAGFWGDDLSFLYDDRDGSSVNIPVDDFLPKDINEAGAVVGDTDKAAIFVYENGVLTRIPQFDGTLGEGQAGGLNDAGTVVGQVGTTGRFDGAPFTAFIYSDGTAQFLDLGIDQGSCSQSEADDINNAGQIVGALEMPTASGCAFRAFLHQDGETLVIGDLLPDRVTMATRINEAGQAIVSVQRPSSDVVGGGAYLWSDGELEPIGNDQTAAHGLNDSGWVVGEFGPRREGQAFLYVNGEVHALADLVPDLEGWERLLSARDVNNSGQIVGLALRSDGQQAAFLLTPLETTVKLDVRPHHAGNRINLRAKGSIIAVAILSTGTFDATQVNWETVKFGRKKAREHHQQLHLKDVDRDGDMDAVLHFKIRQTGIRCVDKSVTLTGKTFSGVPFRGTDRIEPVNCRKKK